MKDLLHNHPNACGGWRRTNKTVAALLVFLLLIGSCLVGCSGKGNTVSGSETKTSGEKTEGLIFAVEEVSGKAGEQVVVPVTLSGSEKLTGFSVTVSYDKDKLELVEDQCEISEISVSNKTVPGKIRLMCTTYGDFSLKTNCTVWTLTFRIKEGTAKGSIPLTIGIEDEKDTVYIYTDKGAEDQNCSFVAGAITVD